MKKSFVAIVCGLSISIPVVFSQQTVPVPAVYQPKNKAIYKEGWMDLNKNGKKDVYEDPSQPIDKRIDDLLSQMTLEEKTCQMVTLYGYQRVLADELPTPEWKNKLWKDGIGAIDEHLNGFVQWGAPLSSSPYIYPHSLHSWAINEVQRFFIEETRLGIPADMTNEGIRGIESVKTTNFPTQLGLGHTWNRNLVYEIGRITGEEARSLGYTNVYAPILDVGRDQRWGRYEEVYGECPYLVSELGIQMVNGLQKDGQVAATAKHYIAYSNNKGAREGMSRVDPQMSPRELENIHVFPFKRVIQETGLLGVMSSYNDYDGIPIQGSFYWLMKRLRGEMGFKGYVVSDSGAVHYLDSKHGTSDSYKESVRQSVEAGLNVRCTFTTPEKFVKPLRELVREGKISEKVINDRVRDVLRVKFIVGLFDTPYQKDLKKIDSTVASEANKKIALQASKESIVLLKNEGNLLPLDMSSIKKIAVIGPNAKEESYATLHYGPQGGEVISVWEGIQHKFGNKATIQYAKGCDLVDPNWPESEILPFDITEQEKADMQEAVELAKNSDIVIAVVGGGERTCGENKSRSSIELPGRQNELLQALYKVQKKIVLVMINGRPLSINWADKYLPAIVEAWYPGEFGGEAVAEVLSGDYNPGGKLTVTFPKSVGQIPFNFPAKPSSQIDGNKKPGLAGNMSRVNGPLYPFGYGLSYTSFEYSDLKLSSKKITENQPLEVSFNITNTGKYAGDEIPQVYIRDVVSSVTTYEKRLAGFERVHLKPGETKRVTCTISGINLQLLNEDFKWVVEPGEFKVMVGASSEKILLNDSFHIVDIHDHSVAEANDRFTSDPISASAANIMDGNKNTQWSGSKGNSITVTLEKDARPAGLTILWGENCSDDASFEIQVMSGGGQFLTVYESKEVSSSKETVVKLKEVNAEELRLFIKQGRLSVAEIKLF